MHVEPEDRTVGEEEWRPFVVSQGFGHLVAAGRGRTVPVVVPTQFLLDGDVVALHLVAANPFFAAVNEQPTVVLSVAGDWAFVPSDWKVIGAEDPALGIPTTYYGAVQLTGRADVVSEPARVAAVLRRQLEALQPATPVADPIDVHRGKLEAIRAVLITVEDVKAKFKYGGNVDVAHRQAVADRLVGRGGPADRSAAAHVRRRIQ
ncbi:MAG: FMN-binding negative transcriptional regulator [Actinomycetota bacterium]|nr:FMN-binding negative transcriptional regulator [Actinomycetota bacterium]